MREAHKGCLDSAEAILFSSRIKYETVRHFAALCAGAAFCAAGFSVLTAAPSVAGYVNGYTRKDGTYVAPHYRSNPNSTQRDNYSTYGNTNPYTGKTGTKKCGLYNSCY